MRLEYFQKPRPNPSLQEQPGAVTSVDALTQLDEEIAIIEQPDHIKSLPAELVSRYNRSSDRLHISGGS